MTNYQKQEAGWQPPPRPGWVERINAEGRGMDIKSVVPLDENSLLEHAKVNTGLSDFGDDNWHEPFQVLVKSLGSLMRCQGGYPLPLPPELWVGQSICINRA